MSLRHYTLIDRIIVEAQAGLSTLLSHLHSARPNPAGNMQDEKLTESDRKHSAGLMRVNHTGEVCAQALYRGQMISARQQKTQTMLQQACDEEVDHLAWTHDRLEELQSHRSYLNFFWYTNSFLIGMIAGAAGDRWSLGFIEETERQVSHHLTGHLEKLSSRDQKSRVIIEKMREDEEHHGANAAKAGAAELPIMIKKLMGLQAKVMTTLAYWI